MKRMNITGLQSVQRDDGYIISYSEHSARSLPIVSTRLMARDYFGWFKARWGINRNNFNVAPGLYLIGDPDKSSPVFVSANYKMSFDTLRKALDGFSAYILVLDTKGINVWCAAGKGTFGTDELVRRIEDVSLKEIVTHRKVVVPQLGAPGIAAHEVKKKTGFKVIYGPVRAEDLPAFLQNQYCATETMRQVRFDLKDRFVLTAVELIQGIEVFLLIIPVILIYGFLRYGTITPALLLDAFPFFGIIVVGTIIVPLLLPWIPGRSFSFKGWVTGMLFTILFNIFIQAGIITWIVNILLFPPISGFIVLNFTGSTTYTSLSGVVKEMRYALPLIIVSLVLGIAGRVVQLFI
jgi:hypothetical protein